MDVASPHYFEPRPSTPSRPRRVRLSLPDLTVELTTDRGVFAAEGVDPGTRFLLQRAPMPAPSAVDTVVDLGCGYGPIAVAVALRARSCRVWAVDVNERARALCRENAAAADLTNVVVAAPDEVPADLAIDRIYSNPPIRVGKAALHEMLTTWLDRLAPGGRAWLVVHRHLGSDSLARWLAAAGWPTRRLGSRTGYRILEVEAPTR